LAGSREGLGRGWDKVGDIGDGRLAEMLGRLLVGGRLGLLHHRAVGELDVLRFGEGHRLHHLWLRLLLVHLLQLAELLIVEGPYFVHLLQTLRPDLLHLLLNHVAEVLGLRVFHQELLLRGVILFLFFDDFHLMGTVYDELRGWGGKHSSALVILAVVVLVLVLVGVERRLLVILMLLFLALALILRLLLLGVCLHL
jgi:hypothetical protein